MPEYCFVLSGPTNNNYFSVDTGNPKVSYYELTSIYGHDTFLLDVINIDGAIKVSKCLFIHLFTFN